MYRGTSAGRSDRVTRLLAVLAAACAALVITACGSGSGGSVHNSASSYGTTLYGSLPTAGTPTSGGDISVGQLSGQTPDFIFPLYDCTHQTTVDSNFVQNFWIPLYNDPVGARPEINYQLSAASGPPTASDGGKTYTIHLRSGLKWSDGKPVTANDVLFYIDMVKQAVKENASNWCSYIPGQFPETLKSASAPNASTVVLKLTKAFNPGYFLNNQIGAFVPLPSTAWNIASAGGSHLDFSKPANAKKIYDYLFAQGSKESAFTSSPLWKDIDGAWQLKDYSLVNGSFDMTPNPKYTGPAKPKAAEISYTTYTSLVAQLNAQKTGALDIGAIDATDLSQAPALRRQGFSVFGNPTWGFYDANLNFQDKTGNFGAIISQKYARQVLFELEDQQSLVKGIYKGAAVPQYGPVPSNPTSPYTPANAVTPPYPYNPTQAVAVLKAHGWHVVPGGSSTCVRPGAAANECGAGVPKGSKFGGVWLNVPEAAAPSSVLSSQVIVSALKRYAGIDFTFKTVSFNQAQNYDDLSPDGKALANQWAVNNTGGFSISLYPTSEGLYNSTGAFNYGAYSDKQADKLMLKSVFSTNPKAVVNEASYLAISPPALFLPNPDAISVISKRVGGPANSFLSLVYQVNAPQYWYIKKTKQ